MAEDHCPTCGHCPTECAERRRVGGVETDRQEAEEIVGRMFNRVEWPDTTRMAKLAIDALENARWALLPPARNDGDDRG